MIVSFILFLFLYVDIEFDFRDKIEGVGTAAEGAGLTLLASESAGFEDGKSKNVFVGEGVFDWFEFVESDVGLDALHGLCLL